MNTDTLPKGHSTTQYLSVRPPKVLKDTFKVTAGVFSRGFVKTEPRGYSTRQFLSLMPPIRF